MSDNFGVNVSIAAAAKTELKEEILWLQAEQLASRDSFTNEQATTTAFNILAGIRPQTLQERSKSRQTEGKSNAVEEGEGEEGELAVVVVKSKQDAGRGGSQGSESGGGGGTFEDEAKKYKQHEIIALLSLREKVKPGASKESILKAVSDLYPTDADLALEAFEFLLNTADNIAHETDIKTVRDEFYEFHQKEIEAGVIIGANATAWGGTNPAELRKLYRDVTHDNPLDPKPLFTTLKARYKGKDLKAAYKFLLSTAGGETKMHGADVNPAIIRVIKEIRTLQCLIAMIAFFKKEKRRMLKSLQKLELDLDVEELEMASLFLDLIGSAYPDPQQFLNMVNPFIEQKYKDKSIEPDPIQKVNTQIIFMSLMRDAVPQVSRELYKKYNAEDEKTTETRIQRITQSMIAGLENLENNLEDLLEEQEDED